jgi:hypothetical protein
MDTNKKTPTVLIIFLVVMALCTIPLVIFLIFSYVSDSINFSTGKQRAEAIINSISKGEDPTQIYDISLYYETTYQNVNLDSNNSLYAMQYSYKKTKDKVYTSNLYEVTALPDLSKPVSKIEWLDQKTGTASEFLTTYEMYGRVTYTDNTRAYLVFTYYPNSYIYVEVVSSSTN